MAETEKYGLLFAMLEPPGEMEEEFNDWYDTDHIPERKAIPGFITAQRFVAYEDSPKYLALYDLQNVGVLHSEAYIRVGPGYYSPWTQRINRHARIFKRYVYVQTSPGKSLISKEVNALLVWMNDIPEGKDEEFSQWYDKECISYLKELEGFIQARRFHCVDGEAKDLALIEFRDLEFLKNEVYRGVLLSDKAIKTRKYFQEAMNKIYKRYISSEASPQTDELIGNTFRYCYGSWLKAQGLRKIL